MITVERNVKKEESDLLRNYNTTGKREGSALFSTLFSLDWSGGSTERRGYRSYKKGPLEILLL